MNKERFTYLDIFVICLSIKMRQIKSKTGDTDNNFCSTIIQNIINNTKRGDRLTEFHRCRLFN